MNEINEESLGRYDSHLGDFKHKTGFTGQIVARCNIVNLPQFGAGEFSLLEVSYRHQDGSGSKYRVVAELKRASSTGQHPTVATFDSNSSPGSAENQLRWVVYSHSFNFSDNAYYVQLRVTRTDALEFPLVTLVRLTQVIG